MIPTITSYEPVFGGWLVELNKGRASTFRVFVACCSIFDAARPHPDGMPCQMVNA